ncbi:unnamed protein product [Coffea canephora]|uniref:Uncharacterized protein n=1 Tax=Coffea canephora TaxID=49390 RepID=A0A068TXY0_COFCA|nr:unnamed protein product [Coffea canephora]
MSTSILLCCSTPTGLQKVPLFCGLPELDSSEPWSANNEQEQQEIRSIQRCSTGCSSTFRAPSFRFLEWMDSGGSINIRFALPG